MNIDYISDNAYNRFPNLDSIEDRIIYYLISEKGKDAEQLKKVHNIWKILYYNDINALNEKLPSQSDISKLVDSDNTGNDRIYKRIFKNPFLDNVWTVECSMLRIYIDSVIPINNKLSAVNIGIDIITHNKVVNVYVDENDNSSIIDVVDGIPITIQAKSRVDVLLQSILYLLNGADVAGVGKMQFNSEVSRYNQARYSLWNNRNYGGFKMCIGCYSGGLS